MRNWNAISVLCASCLACAAYAAEPRPDPAQPPLRVYDPAVGRGAQLTDAQIADAVKRALHSDGFLSPETINVSSGSGTVTLSGSQPMLLARERAAYIAERVPGVRRVINEIVLRPDRPVSGERLTADITAAFDADPTIEGSELQVQANGAGRVVLAGAVDSGAERYVAEQLAKSVIGVTGVDNQIHVQRGVQRADEEIAADVRRMLQWRADKSAPAPDVEVRDGVVTLSGELGSEADKRRVSGLAWVAGVQHVNVTPLSVAQAPSHDVPGERLALTSDAEIAQAVRDAIRSDARIKGAAIEVRVNDRVVTLSGEVPDKASQQIVRNIPNGLLGVASVEDRMRVRGEAATRSEEQ